MCHQPIKRPEVLALPPDRLGEAIDLLSGGRAVQLVRRRRGAADAAIAAAAAGLGTERFLDASVHLLPGAHFLAEIGHATVEVIDGVTLLSDLRGERRGLARQLAELQPVADERAN